VQRLGHGPVPAGIFPAVAPRQRLRRVGVVDIPADGFILGFPVPGQGLDDFIRHILPVLQQCGHFDSVLRGTTLRDHLGLPYRQSRYAGESARELSVAGQGNR
jgi:hypothetical protein